MQEEIINRVANSGLVTINLEEHYPKGERIVLDIKPWLFQEMILREKEFRNHLKEHNWEEYQDKFVAVSCSADAIIPTWAYMLLAAKLAPFAKKVVLGNLQELETAIFQDLISEIDETMFHEKKVVIKGCSDHSIPQQAYLEITKKLLPVTTSIMFGEPCSTVPVYKKPKK